MNEPIYSAEFILLCIIQMVTIGFSVISFIHSFKQYLRIDPSEVILRKSVKYFTFIFITICCAALFSLACNFFYLVTSNGIIAGYLYAAATTMILVNVFCAWQFVTYLIHPERRPTKYIIGSYCLIGIILLWCFAPIVFSGGWVPNSENMGLYVYIWIIFAFVWGVFTIDFIRNSLKSTEKKEKHRFFCMGLSGVFAFLMFPLTPFGQIFPWMMILAGTILLYLGYNFPHFFQRFLKV